ERAVFADAHFSGCAARQTKIDRLRTGRGAAASEANGRSQNRLRDKEAAEIHRAREARGYFRLDRRAPPVLCRDQAGGAGSLRVRAVELDDGVGHDQLSSVRLPRADAVVN